MSCSSRTIIFIRSRHSRSTSYVSLHAENIMKEAGIGMRKWISNDTTLISQWAAKSFDTYSVDTSVSLGSNKTKVLGLANPGGLSDVGY
ncbi:hypothetical protein NPIL_598471 [Nephila pilipes]|uniref:Uncharacterized protein n=1 Tax=Nephila pilipes TaxID=299642 RepID=A0A8X6TIR1_NEPPI|nr:hypothetical protein NPIL_598471 [Nephila pilipes]